MSKVICPYHDDTEPSMHIYGEWAYCFVCKANVKAELLGLPPSAKEIREKREPADIKSNLEYIESLPKKVIRGFELHYNDSGYYLLWPDRSYFVRRNFGGKARYTAPAGVPRPVFQYYKRVTITDETLIVVEGELNAMSLHASVQDPKIDVISPGSANNFVKYIKSYLPYKRVVLVVDRDAPGVVNALYLKNILLGSGIAVGIHAMECDFNEIYQTKGKEEVQAEFKKMEV